MLWAGAFLVIGSAVKSIDPLPLAAARFGIAALPCGAYLFTQRHRPASGGDLLRTLLCGAIGIALYNFLLGTGQRIVPPGATTFIIATQAIFAGVAGALFLREKFGPRAWLGAATALSGVAVISGIDHQSDGRMSGGAYILAAAACSGTYFVIQRPLVRRFGPVWSCAATLTAGAFLLLPWLTAGFGAMRQIPGVAAAVLFLAFGPGLLGYACWMVALRHLSAGRAASLLFLIAPTATLMEAVRDGEPPSQRALVGGALALAGTALALSRRSAPRNGAPMSEPVPVVVE